ncbi:hypothetical protein SDJN02_19681, partial [Cucurbita argyrosperma subsp. argyrosperma]
MNILPARLYIHMSNLRLFCRCADLPLGVSSRESTANPSSILTSPDKFSRPTSCTMSKGETEVSLAQSSSPSTRTRSMRVEFRNLHWALFSVADLLG